LISQSNSYAAVHRFARTRRYSLRRGRPRPAALREERTMSLVRYPKSNESKASGAVSKKRVTQAGSGVPSTFARRLRNAFAATGRLVINIFDAIAEARLQKAMIEASISTGTNTRRRTTTIFRSSVESTRAR
jgi:hypothetical protein